MKRGTVLIMSLCLVAISLFTLNAQHEQLPTERNRNSLSMYNSIPGPQWSYEWYDLFQDRFPSEEGDIECYIRADAAIDINPPNVSAIKPGDSVVVTCTSPDGGGIAVDLDGWPKVFLHVKARYIGCPTSVPNWVDPKPEYLYGPQLEGTYGRYVSDDGSSWTVLQCDSARTSPGMVAPDKFMVDLNDSLFTRGYIVEYYFSAEDSAAQVSYLPENAPSRANLVFGAKGIQYLSVSYIFEMTCLPLGCTDVLYVDDFHGIGTFWGTAEQYWNHTFIAVYPWGGCSIDRYDVNSPSSLVGNGLASSACASHLRSIYAVIIWDSGDLDVGTIGDGSPESDKADDCTLLINWMNYREYISGLWILGDNVARDLSSLTSPQAAELMNTWCGVTLYDDPNAWSYYQLTGGIVTPLISGTSTCVFYHVGIPDQWYAYGDYPSINNFDVLDVTENGVVAATYPPYGGHISLAAAIGSARTNAAGYTIQNMWFGHSYMHMRDAAAGAPLIRNHIIIDVLRGWMIGSGCPPPLDITDAHVPSAYNLSQNFPNPFNPATVIKFDVKERGLVSLRIYSVTGQLVNTLVNEVKDAGSYTVTWDGTDIRGAKVASGVYFYRFVAGNFEQTKKMVLLK